MSGKKAGVRHVPVQGRQRTFMSSSARCLFWRSSTSSSASCSAAFLRSAAASCAASSSICFRRSASRAALLSCRATSSCAASAASCRCRASCLSWLACECSHEDHFEGRATHSQGTTHPGCRERVTCSAKLANREDRRRFLRHTAAQHAALQTTIGPMYCFVHTSLSSHGHNHLKANRKHMVHDIVMCGRTCRNEGRRNQHLQLGLQLRHTLHSSSSLLLCGCSSCCCILLLEAVLRGRLAGAYALRHEVCIHLLALPTPHSRTSG